MRRIILSSALCLLALGLVCGFVISSAHAGIPCAYDCTASIFCSTDTGPECADPEQPFYVYRVWSCPTGNPHHWCPEDDQFMCCWNGEGPYCFCQAQFPRP